MTHSYAADFSKAIVLEPLSRPLSRPAKALIAVAFVGMVLLVGCLMAKSYAAYNENCPYCASFSL